MIGGGGGAVKLDILVVAPTCCKTWVPPSLLTEICPTPPSASWSKVNEFSLPSTAAFPATVVPLIPIVATGVETFIASGPVLAISPLTKLNAPSNMSTAILPLPVDGSKINSSSTIFPPSDSDRVVLSKKTRPTEPLPTVSIVSPWNTGSPIFNSVEVPSNLVAIIEPSLVETSPIERISPLAAWTYWALESAPAKVSTRLPFNIKPLLVNIEGNSKLVK